MTVYKDKKRGTWYTRYRFKDYTGKLKQTTKRGFATKRDAQAYERKQTGKHINTCDMNFSVFCDEYLADLQAHAKESSFISARFWIDQHIRPAFEKRKLSDITANDIRKWENDMLHATKKDGQPYSSTTLCNITARLSIMFNFAVKYYGLLRNPMHIVNPIAKRNTRDDFWTFDEFTQFIRAIPVKDKHYKLIFELLFFSGMRIGELMALSCHDFDFEQNTISINKAYSSVSKKITSPKTASSVRTIPMPKSIMDKVRAYIDSFVEVPERVFYTSSNMLVRKIKIYARKAGIKPISPHGLRHSHASYLIRAGVPITTISQRLGHVNPNTTLKIYSHMYVKDAQNVADLLEKAIK